MNKTLPGDAEYEKGNILSNQKWQVVPRELTPEMTAAMQAAQSAGATLADQYQAALAADENATTARKVPVRGAKTVSAERGEALLEDLYSGMNSMVAQELYRQILGGERRRALALLNGEHMSEQNAKDLYTYCRAKWLKPKLDVVEVPCANLAEFLREADEAAKKANQDRPNYLVRQGLQIIPARTYFRDDKVTFLTHADEIDLDEVKQLWTVVRKS